MDHTGYVAETDEDGQILCLWQHEPGTRFPRPVRNPTKHINALAKSRVSGASDSAVRQWLRKVCH